MKSVDITAVVTFHHEGLMAHRSLSSIIRCCQHAESSVGVKTRIVATLDDADAETRRIVRQHPALRSCDEIVDLSFRDVSLSRNHAIRASDSKYVAVLDGDDHVSVNWLAAALNRATAAGTSSIIHPQMVVTFGAASGFREQPDQSCTDVDKYGLLVTNFWNVCAFGAREIFLGTPYVSTGSGDSGYGFEDWHWNCETMAAGYSHLTAPRTVYFERHKHSGSLNRSHQSAGAVIRPSKLFRQP